MKELKKKHLDPVLERVRGPEGAKVSFKEIDDGCAIIELEYKSRAVGSKDVRAQVFHEFHQVSNNKNCYAAYFEKALGNHCVALSQQSHILKGT